MIEGGDQTMYRLWYLVRIGAALLFLAAFVVSQEKERPPLQAHLDPEASEWVLGVPIQLTVSLQNISNEPIQTRTSDLNPGWGLVKLFISEDGSKFHPFWGPEWDTYDGVLAKITLQPSAKVQASFALLWNGRITDAEPTAGFAFPHAGIYFVRAAIFSDFGNLMSNVVRVVIKEPHDDDAAIWEQLKTDKKLTRYYQYPNSQVEEGEKLQKLLTMYPHSSHAAAMEKVLAVHARHKHENESLKNIERDTPMR